MLTPIARRLIVAVLVVPVLASPVLAGAPSCCRRAATQAAASEQARCCCAARESERGCCGKVAELENSPPGACCAKNKARPLTAAASSNVPCCCKARQVVPAVNERRSWLALLPLLEVGLSPVEEMWYPTAPLVARQEVSKQSCSPHLALHALHCRWLV